SHCYEVNEDILLRPLTMKDAQQSYDVVCKNRSHLKPSLPWVEHVNCLEDEVKWLKSSMQDIQNGTSLQMGIFETKTSKLIGMCGFVNISDRNGWIGYWLGSDFTGKGLMTQCCRKVMEIGFQKLKLKKLIIHAKPENRKSQAVAERLGFVCNGELQNVLYFGVESEMMVYECT
uniref:N-acetyltransferase domain-containing protein n=1 Tax=Ciona savignyi TaxID=51511 RepID=H2YVI2_CIOSA